MACACGHGVVPAARFHQPHLPERCVTAFSMDTAALAVSGEFHSVFRSFALVPAQFLPAGCCDSPAAHGMVFRLSESQAGNPDVSRGPLRVLYVLPRRIDAAQAIAALSHALLPDDFARRRD